MNLLIATYFKTAEALIAQSRVVARYEIKEQAVRVAGGLIRLKLVLLNGDLLELFEYVHEQEGQLVRSKYSYHWQDANGRLVQRWDNAPHFMHLPHAPHHIHTADGAVMGAAVPPQLVTVLQEIEQTLLG